MSGTWSFWTQGWTRSLLAVKVLILIEALWAVYGGIVLFVFRGDTALAGVYLLDMILSVLAHLGTPLTLVFMLHKLQKGHTLPFLRSWWLMASLLLEIVLTISSFVDFPADTVERNLLRAYSLGSMLVSGAALIVYIIVIVADMITGKAAAKAASAADVMEAAEQNVQGASAISFGQGTANLRFPLPVNARIVHQPRKDL